MNENQKSLTDVSYWQDVYRMELDHFDECVKQTDKTEPNTGRGQYDDDYLNVENEWFGDKVSFALIDWAKRTFDCDFAVPIIDLGCGQGALLNKLAKANFTDLTGVDFSQNAIVLARKLAAKNNNSIVFAAVDVLTIGVDCAECMKRKYAIVIDKGTYDAITLETSTSHTNHTKYVQSVRELMMVGTKSFFVITSCNFTAGELQAKFAADFRFVEEIKCNRIFYFASRGGRVNSTVVFARK